MKKVLLLIFCLCLFFGCKEQFPELPEVRPFTLVKTEGIELTPIFKRSYRTVGNFAAKHTYSCGFELSGQVKEVLVDENQTVVKDQTLATLDLDYYDKRLTLASALRKKAEREFQNAKSAGISVYTRAFIDGLEDIKDAAVAEYELAVLTRKKAVCKAPADGLIEKILVNAEEVVAVGQPIFYIIVLNQLKFQVKVPQEIVAQLRVQSTRASIEIIDLEEIKCLDAKDNLKPRLTRIYNESDAVFQYTIEFMINNANRRILPGMLAYAEIDLPPLENVYVFDIDCVELEGDTAFIWFKHRMSARAHRWGLKNWQIIGRQLVTQQKPPFTEVIIQGYSSLVENERIQVLKGE